MVGLFDDVLQVHRPFEGLQIREKDIDLMVMYEKVTDIEVNYEIQKDSNLRRLLKV